MAETRANILRILALCCAVSLGSASLFAQSETGAITGTITDQSGGVLPNAKVTIKNTATNAVRSTTTNADGIFTATNLPPSTYVVTAEANGFSTAKHEIVVAVGTRMSADMQLQVGTGATIVEVSASAATVNTETQTMATVVNTKQIVELPTLSRDPYSLVATAGNVSGNTPDGRGVGYAINGMRASSTNILLDGTANNDEFASVVGQNIPLDAVQEFSVITNNFTAEYGRATGGIVNVVTKSGTNSFHGTGYDFGRYSALASNDFNSNANGLPKPVFTRNQYGYSIGGPAIKDKLFFFSATEWTKVRSMANSQVYLPTSQLLGYAAANTQQFFSTYGAMAQNVTTLGTYTKTALQALGVDMCKGLAATSKCAAIPSNVPLFQRVNYAYPSNSGGGTPTDTYSTVNRVDFNQSEKTQMYVRYALYSQADFDGSVSSSPYDGYNTPNKQYNNSVVYSLTRTFKPTFISQTKVDFNRFNNTQPFSSKYGDVPTLYMNSSGTAGFPGGSIIFPGYSPFTPGSGIPFGGPQNFVQLYQDMSWMKGKHSIRFGGSYNYLRDNRTFGAYETAGFYLGTTLPKSLENLLLGDLNSMTVAVNPQGKFPCGATVTADCTITMPAGPPSFSRSNRYHDYALYLQDAWKVTSRITLNLGVRWEVYGTQHNKNGNLDANYYLGDGSSIYQQITNGNILIAPQSPMGKLWATNYKNYAPKLGFAWDVFGDGKTSLRGGYSIAYERNFGNVTFNIIQNPPNYASVSITAGVDFPLIPITTSNYGPLAGSTGSKALPKVTLRAVDPNIKTAYAHLYSLALERNMGHGLMAALEYSGSAGEDQYGISNINRIGYGNLYGGVPCTPGTDGDYGTCSARLRNTQYSSINFRTNGGSSSYNALTARMDIHGNHGLNMRLNYTWSHTIDDLSDTFSSGVANLGWLNPFAPSQDKGNAYFDQRHRFVVAGTWDVGMKSAKGMMKQVVDGWTIAPILTMVSGSPFSIYDCTNGWNACPYAFATKAVPTGGYSLTANGNPNSYNYLDLSQYFSSTWYDPKTGLSDVGTYPSNMVGRNRFLGPGSWNLDAGLYKRFFVGEKFNLQFRAEGYNFFNHPNLSNPGYQDVSSGQFVTTGFNGRRFFQMALKLIF